MRAAIVKGTKQRIRVNFYKDVLDSMNKTPREFGTVHVFLEDFKLTDRKRYAVSVLVQAAFEPMSAVQFCFRFQGEEGTIHFHCAATMMPWPWSCR
jgi:hypothetical protein